MRYISVIIRFSFILLALGCKKSPELEMDYIPVFNGTVKTTVSYKKIFFSAAFGNLNPADAEDCGFDWSKSTGGANNTVSIGKTTNENFSAQLAVKLEEGMEYQVRAWIKIGSKKFYSQSASFFGTVALKPEIISLNRTYALWGDTLRIKVRHLLPDVLPADINVTIENSKTSCVYADSSEIAVIMPYSFTTGKLNISLQINNQSATNSAEIENALPEITSISKNLVFLEDTITITGKFWPEYANRVFPVYDDWFKVKYKVVSYTNDKVVFKIPDEGACLPRFDVYFVITSPQGVMSQDLIRSSLKLTRTGNWEILSHALPEYRVAATSVNGEAYVIEIPSNYHTVSPFYKYSPINDSWTVLPSKPSWTYDHTSLIACMGEIYAGFTRNAEPESNFVKYNIQSNTWIPCANLPANCGPWDIIAVALKNKIYAFIIGTKSKWVYDPSLDSWTESYCDVPDLIMKAKSFMYNGEWYIYRGNSGDVIYKYDPSSDSFLPISINGMSSTSEFFEINNKFYCRAGCTVYEVNISNRTLTPISKFSNYIFNENFLYDYDAFFLGYGNTAYFLAASRNVVAFTPNNKK